jgi:hypothetical protein
VPHRQPACRFRNPASLFLGTLSPNPWDLALYRQNACHYQTAAPPPRRQSRQPANPAIQLAGFLVTPTGRIWGDP